ncbi:4-oxalocrotonate tautomerase family protein [Zhouia sp. PK063]|uniref:4-oxalocrotonate tautomerase family protein n=1 Tax=Zhouia sp. PK063 TaxID=3373602 RepID=UPI0037B85FE6
MPLIYINCPKGTFSHNAKTKMANQMTEMALEVEKLPKTAFIKSTCWIYFNEYPKENIFHGGYNTGTNVVSLEVNAFKGGLTTIQKKVFIKKFTDCIHYYMGLNEDVLTPVYIIFRDVEAESWGVFGDTIQLSDLHNPPTNAKPI